MFLCTIVLHISFSTLPGSHSPPWIMLAPVHAAAAGVYSHELGAHDSVKPLHLFGLTKWLAETHTYCADTKQASGNMP